MQSLYFIRHGESEDNLAGVWSRPSSPLTSKGRGQARKAAQDIKRKGLAFDVIVVSTLPRALETAKIIAAEIGYPEKAIEPNELFAERDWGALTGTSSAEFYDGTRTLTDIDNAPDAETLSALQARASKGLDYLRAKPHATILLIGHGSFARALRRVINDEPHTNEYVPNLIRYQNGEVAKLI